MKYEINGDSLPVLKVRLEAGEQVTCEAGAMSWMDDEIEMQTEAGGLGKMLGRAITLYLVHKRFSSSYYNIFMVNTPYSQ